MTSNYIKCLLILQRLSDAAMEDAVKQLEEVENFYSNEVNPERSISRPFIYLQGKIKQVQERPPIVLDDD